MSKSAAWLTVCALAGSWLFSRLSSWPHQSRAVCSHQHRLLRSAALPSEKVESPFDCTERGTESRGGGGAPRSESTPPYIYISPRANFSDFPKTADREHIDDEDGGQACWCRPDMVFEWSGRQLWVHHGEGEELPPARIVVSAIADLIADR